MRTDQEKIVGMGRDHDEKEEDACCVGLVIKGPQSQARPSARAASAEEYKNQTTRSFIITLTNTPDIPAPVMSLAELGPFHAAFSSFSCPPSQTVLLSASMTGMTGLIGCFATSHRPCLTCIYRRAQLVITHKIGRRLVPAEHDASSYRLSD
jgi:hypothetical protein